MRPVLEKIAEITGETVHLVERQGGSVVYIDKCESTINSVRMVSRIGMTLDIFTTAVGKAMSAHLSKGDITRLWEGTSHIKKTENTIVDLEEYLKEIEKVKKQGFAVDDQENERDVRCVAVALPNAYGEYKYAVSVSAPKSRTDDNTFISRAKLLKELLEKF